MSLLSLARGIVVLLLGLTLNGCGDVCGNEVSQTIVSPLW